MSAAAQAPARGLGGEAAGRRLLLTVGGLLLLVTFFLTALAPLSDLRSAGGTTLLLHLRLPRAAAAVLAGAGLAVSGALLQAVTRNPLASPGLLGVNAGAQLGLVAGLLWLPALPLGGRLPFAFLGGLAAALLTLLVAGGQRAAPIRLALAGIAVSLALGAFSGAILLLHEQQLGGLFLWGAGSTAQSGWAPPLQALWQVGAGLAAALLLARGLDLLALDEEAARGRGLAAGRLRLLAGLLATLLAAAAVSLCGPIGFVGLIVPNLLRLLGVHRHALLLPLAALWGAVLLLAADLAGRLPGAVAGGLPAGVVVALIGGPFLIWLVVRLGRRQPPEVEPPLLAPRPRPGTLPFRLALLALLLPVGLAATASLGEPMLSPAALWRLLVAPETAGPAALLLELRLPRALVAALAGAMLAGSGLLLQAVVRNPLAGPELLGVTQGAALAALLLLLAWPGLPLPLLQLAALAGGLGVLALLYGLSRRAGSGPARLALIGIALSGIAAALASLIVLEARLQVAQALVWLAGTTYGRGWAELRLLLPWAALGLGAAWLLAPVLSLLALGDERARSLGLAVERVRLLLLLIAVALAAAAVAAVGAIAFVGLVAPHAARLLVGERPRSLCLAAPLLGAGLMLLADLLARTLFAPTEVPSGLVVAVLGAPYFLFLLLRLRRGTAG